MRMQMESGDENREELARRNSQVNRKLTESTPARVRLHSEYFRGRTDQAHFEKDELNSNLT